MPATAAQVRAWTFTINNPLPDTQPDDNPQKWFDDGHVTYVVWQKERGEKGTPHFQGYVLWARKKTLAGCKKIHKTCHWEPRYGTHEQARHYCMKPHDGCACEHCEKARIGFPRLEGPWEVGDAPKPGERKDLELIKKDIKDGKSWYELWETNFNTMLRYHRGLREYREIVTPQRTWQTEVAVFYGETGTGKSRWLFEHLNLETTFWINRSRSDGNPWMDGYDPMKHTDVVIDEFTGWIDFETFKRMLDRYPCRLEGKGYTVNFRPLRIWITSNLPPDGWYNYMRKGVDYAQIERRLHYVVEFTEEREMLVKKDVLQ